MKYLKTSFILMIFTLFIYASVNYAQAEYYWDPYLKLWLSKPIDLEKLSRESLKRQLREIPPPRSLPPSELLIQRNSILGCYRYSDFCR